MKRGGYVRARSFEFYVAFDVRAQDSSTVPSCGPFFQPGHVFLFAFFFALSGSVFLLTWSVFVRQVVFFLPGSVFLPFFFFLPGPGQLFFCNWANNN